jgi:hypothetical protein
VKELLWVAEGKAKMEEGRYVKDQARLDVLPGQARPAYTVNRVCTRPYCLWR